MTRTRDAEGSDIARRRLTRGGFTHVLADDRQVERFNAEGGTPIRLVPRRKILTPILFDGAKHAGLSVWRTYAAEGFLSTPTAAADLVTIRHVTCGGIVRRDLFQQHVAGAGQAMMVMFDAMRDEEASEGFEALSATVAVPTLLSAQAALEETPGPLPAFAPVVQRLDPPMRALLQAIRSVHEQVRAGVGEFDLTFPLLAEIVGYQILTSWPRLGPGMGKVHRIPRPRTVRRAKEFIDANLSRKLLLSDIAQAAGVGVRRLQVAFRTEVGRTPVGYIVDRRLERVRTDLLSRSEARTPVQAIAERWGFTHMGDFSRRYRERFGESPSSTRGALGHLNAKDPSLEAGR